MATFDAAGISEDLVRRFAGESPDEHRDPPRVRRRFSRTAVAATAIQLRENADQRVGNESERSATNRRRIGGRRARRSGADGKRVATAWPWTRSAISLVRRSTCSAWATSWRARPHAGVTSAWVRRRTGSQPTDQRAPQGRQVAPVAVRRGADRPVRRHAPHATQPPASRKLARCPATSRSAGSAGSERMHGPVAAIAAQSPSAQQCTPMTACARWRPARRTPGRWRCRAGPGSPGSITSLKPGSSITTTCGHDGQRVGHPLPHGAEVLSHRARTATSKARRRGAPRRTRASPSVTGPTTCHFTGPCRPARRRQEAAQAAERVVVGVEVDGGQRVEPVGVEPHVTGVVDGHAADPDQTMGQDPFGRRAHAAARAWREGPAGAAVRSRPRPRRRCGAGCPPPWPRPPAPGPSSRCPLRRAGRTVLRMRPTLASPCDRRQVCRGGPAARLGATGDCGWYCPVTVGWAVGRALADASAPFGAWRRSGSGRAGSVGLVAALVPATVSLTTVRLLAPGPAVIAAMVLVADPGWPARWPSPWEPSLALVAFRPEVGRTFVQASAYGDEARYPLRPPGAVLLGPLPLLWSRWRPRWSAVRCSSPPVNGSAGTAVSCGGGRPGRRAAPPLPPPVAPFPGVRARRASCSTTRWAWPRRPCSAGGPSCSVSPRLRRHAGTRSHRRCARAGRRGRAERVGDRRAGRPPARPDERRPHPRLARAARPCSTDAIAEAARRQRTRGAAST